jgi:hypothetical protein
MGRDSTVVRRRRPNAPWALRPCLPQGSVATGTSPALRVAEARSGTATGRREPWVVGRERLRPVAWRGLAVGKETDKEVMDRGVPD